MKVPLSWIKKFTDYKGSAEDLADKLTFGGLEVEDMHAISDDVVFDINVTANRADCLSVIGISREAAALTGSRFSDISIKPSIGRVRISAELIVEVKNDAACPRYMTRIIQGVKIAPSPDWLVKALGLVGIRPINNVVDATNYVMWEIGQPLHAFDRRYISDNKIVIRNASDNEVFVTLDGVERKLTQDDLLIADNERGIALAGVMGGKNSEVRDDTTEVVLESAYFHPTNIAKTSKRLGLVSESSRRFERGVDPNRVNLGLHRLTELILELAGGEATLDWIDASAKTHPPSKVNLSLKRLSSILGIEISPDRTKKLLNSIGLKLVRKGREELVFEVPTFRGDLTRDIDLIEEIARLHGYENIPETMPTIAIKMPAEPANMNYISKAKGALKIAGMTEARLLSFTSLEKLSRLGAGADVVELANPFSNEDAALSTTLIPGLLDLAALNFNRQKRDISVFTIQNVYRGDKEELSLAGFVSGRNSPYDWSNDRVVDFYDLKRIVETVFLSLGLKKDVEYLIDNLPPFLHPGEGANISYQGESLGCLGKMNPKTSKLWDIEAPIYIFEMNFSKIAEISRLITPEYAEISKFPSVERDFAILVSDDVTVDQIMKEILSLKVNFLKNMHLFDIYKGKSVPDGQKSLAFRLNYGLIDRTLTDEEVNSAQEKIIEILNKNCNAQLRT
ncbi:MAG: phenylalanine--tRNA ligase subunit beta [Pseudomonadota bacterium]